MDFFNQEAALRISLIVIPDKLVPSVKLLFKRKKYTLFLVILSNELKYNHLRAGAGAVEDQVHELPGQTCHRSPAGRDPRGLPVLSAGSPPRPWPHAGDMQGTIHAEQLQRPCGEPGQPPPDSGDGPGTWQEPRPPPHALHIGQRVQGSPAHTSSLVPRDPPLWSRGSQVTRCGHGEGLCQSLALAL